MRGLFVIVAMGWALAASALAQTPPETSTACKLDQVAAYDTRVHVRCKEYDIYRDGSGAEHRQQSWRNAFDPNVIYFAVDAHSPLADRVVALASAAGANDDVTIFFRTNAAENPPGCLPADCRKLTGLVLPIPH